MGFDECGQKKDSYKRELKEMRAMIKEAHRAGKAAKVRAGVHAVALRGGGVGVAERGGACGWQANADGGTMFTVIR